MIEHSAAYDKAITSDSRRQFIRAVFDLVDPDYQFGSLSVSDESPFSLTQQVSERSTGESEQNIGSLELDRWRLDGSFTIEPDDKNDRVGHSGWETYSLSGEDGAFAAPPYIDITFSGVDFMQALTAEFSHKSFEGVADSLTVQVWAGDNLVDTKTVTGNTDPVVVVDGMEVYSPTHIRMTVTRWSLPYRRVRCLRLMVGLYEEWDNTTLSDADIYTEVTFSGLALPYSTCTLTVYNENHRFDPYAPSSVFQSIEERQSLKVDAGVRIDDGSVEWLPAGVYYQQSGGWKLNDLTIQWTLVDIIGMLVKRQFELPDVMPSNLGGWVQAIVASMGVNFHDKYLVDSDVASIPLTADAADVGDKTCGELLRFACMATNTWARQDMQSGLLRVGKLQTPEGNRITLDNMNAYPVMQANDDIADLTFALDEGSVVFPGTNTQSDVSLSINNPFVHTVDDARKASISCFFEYGGKVFQVNHRGNPSSSVGDIQTVDTQFETTISARLYKQQLKFEKGVMRNVPSYLIQSPNDSTYQNKVILTGSGSWTAPVTGTVKATLVAGGNGGQGGGGGVMKGVGIQPDPTSGGSGGLGGMVFIVEFGVNEGSELSYSCGRGGSGGSGGDVWQDGFSGGFGGATTFGVYTSNDGNQYPNGLMDIQSGAVYGMTGPDNGGRVMGQYGTGGAGGVQGKDGLERQVEYQDENGNTRYEIVTVSEPTPGTAGGRGQDGCIILEW